MLSKETKEYIFCAAIWYKDGKQYEHQPSNIEEGYVMFGRRHHNIISLHYALTNIPTLRETSVQGFITSKDRFVNRSEGMTIAKTSGQVGEKGEGLLFSEDLY